MTTDTTVADPRRRNTVFVRLLIASAAIHVVLIILLGPWIRSRMEFDRREGETRAEEVRQREQQRQLSDLERREQMLLSEQQSRTLREEYERRRGSLLRERFNQLEQIAAEMRRVRWAELQKMHERTESDVVMSRINRLRQIADGTTHRGENVKAYTKRPELSKHLDDQAERRIALLDRLARTPDDYERLVGEVTELAYRQFDEITHQQEIETQGGQAHRMKAVKASLVDLANEAESLAFGVDLKQANDVSAAPPSTPRDAPPVDASAATLYRATVELERTIQDDFNVTRATELAHSRGAALADTMPSADVRAPDRPDLGDSLENPASRSVADMDRFRQALDRADQETADMRTRALGLLAQAGGDTSEFDHAPATTWSSPQAVGGRGMVIAQAVRGAPGRVIDMTTVLGGAAGGYLDSEGLREADYDSGIRDPIEALRLLVGPELRINPDVAQRNALPGREFTDASDRKGWLFIDTWYVIGPWENEGQLRHDVSHPPEQVIDFDAEYTDGKFADMPGHPYQRLRWRFYQSDQIRCQPPAVYNDSTYYAYTEISSDRDREVLLTISTDDAAKAWLNGQPVWEDVGLSPWMLGEGFRRIPLRQGYNTLLVRIENGPLHCVWSVLLCPPEVMRNEASHVQ